MQSLKKSVIHAFVVEKPTTNQKVQVVSAQNFHNIYHYVTDGMTIIPNDCEFHMSFMDVMNEDDLDLPAVLAKKMIDDLGIDITVNYIDNKGSLCNQIQWLSGMILTEHLKELFSLSTLDPKCSIWGIDLCISTTNAQAWQYKTNPGMTEGKVKHTMSWF